MEWIFYLLCFVPLVFCPRQLYNGFSLPQTAFLGLLSTVGLMLGVSGLLLLPVSAPSIFIIIFAIYLLFSSMWSFPQHNYNKEIGLQLPLILVFLLGSTFLVPENIRWIAACITTASFLSSLYAIFQTYELDPFFPNKIKRGGRTDEPIGTIGNKNYYSSYVSISFWFSIYAGISIHYLFFIVSAFIFYMIIKAKVRAGQLAMIGSGLLFIGMSAYCNQIQYRTEILVSIFSLIALAIIISTYLLYNYWDKFWHEEIDPKGKQVWYATFRYRLCYWLLAWELIKKSPIFGHGLFSYRRLVYEAQGMLNDKYKGFLNPKRYITPQPREVHNDYLEHLVEHGLFGTIIFFVAIAILYINSIYYLNNLSGFNFFLMLALLSGLTAALINMIFFFTLRLTAPALMFWILAACINVVTAKEVIVLGESNWLVIGGTLILWGYFIWQTIAKRVIASRFFAMSFRQNEVFKRFNLLMKALKFAPNDTLIRTNASLVSMDHIPETAIFHAINMLENYDGSVTKHGCFYNVALAMARMKRNLNDCAILLKQSHWMLPSFEPTLTLLNAKDGIGARTKWTGGKTKMKIVDDGVLWKIRTIILEKENLNLRIENFKRDITNLHQAKEMADTSIENELIRERRKLNIPDNWPFDPHEGNFINPENITEENKQNLIY